MRPTRTNKRGLMAPHHSADMADLDQAAAVETFEAATATIRGLAQRRQPNTDAAMTAAIARADRAAEGLLAIPTDDPARIAQKVRAAAWLSDDDILDFMDPKTVRRIAESTGNEDRHARALLAIFFDVQALAHVENGPLIAEATELLAQERASMEGDSHAPETWDARFMAVLRQIDELPPTPANIEAKLLGLRMIHENCGGFDAWSADTTDARLSRDIFKAMLIERGVELPTWLGVDAWRRELREATNCDVFADGSAVRFKPAEGNWGNPNTALAAAMFRDLSEHRKALVVSAVREQEAGQ